MWSFQLWIDFAVGFTVLPLRLGSALSGILQQLQLPLNWCSAGKFLLLINWSREFSQQKNHGNSQTYGLIRKTCKLPWLFHQALYLPGNKKPPVRRVETSFKAPCQQTAEVSIQLPQYITAVL